MTTKYEET